MHTLLSVLLLSAVFSTQALAAETLVIGVTPFPHKDIMLTAKPLLEKEGFALEIKEFSDYILPNVALADKSLTANFFQHIPYLDNMNKEKKLDLAWIAKVHIEPMGLYSQKITTLEELKPGDSIAVPSDPTNGARALRLLEAHGLLKLKNGELVTARDVTENPRQLKIRELEAPQLPRALPDVTAAVINTNFAAEAKLNPSRNALIIEGADSPYANVLVIRAADRNTPVAEALIKAVQSPEVKAFLKTLEDRGIVPAF